MILETTEPPDRLVFGDLPEELAGKTVTGFRPVVGVEKQTTPTAVTVYRGEDLESALSRLKNEYPLELLRDDQDVLYIHDKRDWLKNVDIPRSQDFLARQIETAKEALTYAEALQLLEKDFCLDLSGDRLGAEPAGILALNCQDVIVYRKSDGPITARELATSVVEQIRTTLKAEGRYAPDFHIRIDKQEGEEDLGASGCRHWFLLAL